MSTELSSLLAQLVIATGGLSGLALIALHFVSAEFQPSWRMISEYALGKHQWLITAFFVLWGISSFLLSLLLWPQMTQWWGLVGVGLLLLSAIGEVMGGVFDVKHPWHGWAFGIGVPSLPLAALLIGYNLVGTQAWSSHRSSILIATHATWISFILMGVAMAVMFAGFKRAGIPMDANTPPPDKVPDGVIAWGGYANRLLILCYVGWVLVIAKVLLE